MRGGALTAARRSVDGIAGAAGEMISAHPVLVLEMLLSVALAKVSQGSCARSVLRVDDPGCRLRGLPSTKLGVRSSSARVRFTEVASVCYFPVHVA